MNISEYLKEFVGRKENRYKPYSKIYKTMLTGGREYSLNSQEGYDESEYLYYNIPACVKAYSNNKDTAIILFKDLLLFLKEKGVEVPHVNFPPVPVSNTFERLMFIAKYLQEKDSRISNLPEILWVSQRQIEADLAKLRGKDNDPIQVCGKPFYIEDTNRKDGRITFKSTAHPLFLAENLSQVLIMLKGLKQMAEDPLYQPYAEETAREIWEQLSTYAKDRILIVFKELLPEDYGWYKSLEKPEKDNRFYSEENVSRKYRGRVNVVLDCIKNGKTFCMEYHDVNGIRFYKDCTVVSEPFKDSPPGFLVRHSEGGFRMQIDNVIRSAYSIEELISD